MTVWFAILTHNRPKSLLALVRSIDQQKLPIGWARRIVIWDNASSDASRREFLASSRSKAADVIYQFSSRNLFMVGKRELERLVLADCDVANDLYAHLDDDVLLESGWLNAALHAMNTYRFDACGSVEPREGKLMVSGQSELRFRDVLIDQNHIRVWQWTWEAVGERQVMEVAFAGHRALLTRMECVRKVRHDQELHIGGEDVDYSLSLRKAGYRIGIARGAAIRHRARGEGEIPGFRTRERVIQSWRHFYSKWGFVRIDACEEAGLSPEDWLRLFAPNQRAGTKLSANG
jgi:GT2 family glycosyltransferase